MSQKYEVKEHFQAVYDRQSKTYDLLVAREDYQENILKTLTEICSLKGAKVVEFGAGTGRLTALIQPQASFVLGFDESPQMLFIAKEKLAVLPQHNWRLATADNREIPVFDQSADVSLAGWTIGHLTEWYPRGWKNEVSRALNEMRRVLKPTGTSILLESLGTGSETPFAPKDALSEFYSLLEKEHGYQQKTIRTDFKFESLEEAEGMMRLFYGESMASWVREKRSCVVPAHTGVWFRKNS